MSEYKRCFPIGFIKEMVVVAWICSLKIETKNKNGLQMGDNDLDESAGVRSISKVL